MAEDWLFSIGLDTTKANSELSSFVNKTTETLNAAQKSQANASTNSTKTQEQDALRLMATRVRIAGQAQRVSDSYYGQVASKAASTASMEIKETERVLSAKQSANRIAVALAEKQARAEEAAIKSLEVAQNRLTAAQSNASRAQAQMQEGMMRSAERGAGSVRRQGDAFDYMGKQVGFSIKHLIEYQVIMASVEAAMGAFSRGMKMAADIQLEQTFQGLYNSTINLNDSLKASQTIAPTVRFGTK